MIINNINYVLEVLVDTIISYYKVRCVSNVIHYKVNTLNCKRMCKLTP